jgi:hypothetical protein
MLATSTYAWFTSNKTVSVNSLSVSINAKNGIQISADGTNWKSILKTTDITGAHTTYPTSVNQLPDILETSINRWSSKCYRKITYVLWNG